VWNRRTTGDRIVAARVGTNGTVLDPSGFVVATGSTAQTVPAVDTAGSVFLVAWQDRRTTDDVYAARVATSGQVLDPSGFVVASTADPDQEPSVVRGPSGPALVAWQQGQDDANVLGVRIEANGTVDRPAVLFSTAASDQTRPAIAWNGSIYLAAWSDHRLGGIGISYSRLSADGASLDGTGIQLVSGTQPFISPSNPAVAAGVNGTTREFLLVWEDRRSAGPSQIWGARVAANGTVLDPGGFRIFARGTDALMLPAVAWDGTNFLVAWEELKFGAGGVPGVSATRVAPDGTVLDSGGITITNSTSSKFGVAVAGNAGGFLVAWADDRSGNADVFARRVSPQGSALGTGPTVVAQASGGQTWPAAATQGSAFLVAWKSVDQVNNVHKVFARRISATGAVLDPGITVFPYAGTPAATWNGTTYLVAAGTSNGVLGQRIGSTGVKQDGNGFPISPQGDEAMAARGTGARVAVGYVRPAPERPYGSDLRGFVRFIDPT
jgi:hypothetical protein